MCVCLCVCIHIFSWNKLKTSVVFKDELNQRDFRQRILEHVYIVGKNLFVLLRWGAFLSLVWLTGAPKDWFYSKHVLKDFCFWESWLHGKKKLIRQYFVPQGAFCEISWQQLLNQLNTGSTRLHNQQWSCFYYNETAANKWDWIFNLPAGIFPSPLNFDYFYNNNYKTLCCCNASHLRSL